MTGFTEVRGTKRKKEGRKRRSCRREMAQFLDGVGIGVAFPCPPPCLIVLFATVLISTVVGCFNVALFTALLGQVLWSRTVSAVKLNLGSCLRHGIPIM